MTILFVLTMTILAVFLAARLRSALKRFRIKKMYTAALSAPSVSVCIPARNETHAMTECLERVLASDYRKMEVIVYDDSSIDDTSILIRSFAHAGVRFVPGSDLPEGWLGKNHALEVLVREASGTFVVFMDVDTHIRPTTISQLVGYITAENVDMMSVVPGRNDGWRASVLFGTLRYFWALVLSRSSAPASASSLWMIKRDTLLSRFDGFRQHPQDVSPEASFAKIFGATGYHCLVNNMTLGVTYEKKWRSQVETARRLYFPRLGGSFVKVLLSLAVLLLLNLPFAIVLSGLFVQWQVLHSAAVWFLCVFIAIYAVYTSHLWHRAWWMGGLLWPLIILQELFLLVSSVWGHKLGTITWKGRPISGVSKK